MDTCSDTLKFDTTKLTSDFASQVSFLQYVNAENYDEMKSEYGANIPGYFDGSFTEFQRKRARLQSLIASSQVSTVHQDYYRHALSVEGLKAYSACMLITSQNLLAAWVDEFGKDVVTVKVKTGVLGDEKVSYLVTGGSPNEELSELSAGGSQALSFPYKAIDGLTLTFNGTARKSGGQMGVSLVIPGVRKLERRTIPSTVSGAIYVGAGGFGNTSGNPIAIPGVLVAQPGCRLVPSSIEELGRERFWSGGGEVTQFQFNKPETKNADGEVVRIDLIPSHPDSTNGDEQCKWTIHYQCRQERDVIVDVTPA